MTEQSKVELRLTMGKWFVGDSSEIELVAPCLGSCVAVCLYEPNEKIGGMAHTVFPSRKLVPNNLAKDRFPSARYADEVVGLLVDELIKKTGHNNLHLVAKLVGGAQMFKGLYSKSGFPNIGSSNVKVLRRELVKWSIPIINCDVGGTTGRTVVFDSHSGAVFIRRIGDDVQMKL